MINTNKKTLLNGSFIEVYECEKCKGRTLFPKEFGKSHKCIIKGGKIKND